jgi:hypothetical protein
VIEKGDQSGVSSERAFAIFAFGLFAAVATMGVYSSPVPCEERKRLEKIYFDAVRNNAIAGAHILNTKSEAWREATKETRAACDVALEALNRHRERHGC